MTVSVNMTRVKDPTIIQIKEEWNVAHAQREVASLADAIGFSTIEKYQIITSITELANNLLIHAIRGGTIAIILINRNGETGLEIIAEDDGPGISDIEWSIRDNTTTKGSLGSGLAGTRRLMDEFEITSTVGVGTRIIVRKWLPCK